jgi:hypothetical protein
MFRKGKALGELGFFEKASKVLNDLKTQNPPGMQSAPIKEETLPKVFPTDATIADQEIARLKAIDDEKERVHKKKLKGTRYIVGSGTHIILTRLVRLPQQGREERKQSLRGRN